MTNRSINIAIMVFCIVTFLMVIPIALALELWEEHRD